jgi:hypothetical protein
MADISAVIEKVKKLLALSTSSNANEAANAMALANKLIDQYRLDIAELEDKEHSEPIEEDDGYIYESGKITQWKSSLVMTLAGFYGCAVWNDTTINHKTTTVVDIDNGTHHYSEASGRKVSRYRLVGRRSDIGITRYMFAYITAEIARLSAIEAKGKGRVFVNSYCMGFVSGVRAQLNKSRVEVQQSATSNAIVKINAREEEATVAMHNMHTGLRASKTTSHSRVDRDAFYRGKERGASMHLGASLSAGNTKMLGS